MNSSVVLKHTQPWLSINRLDLNPEKINQCSYLDRLNNVMENFPVCTMEGMKLGSRNLIPVAEAL